MSEFENTNLPFLEQDCIETFGKECGKKIFGKTLEIYRELTRKADYRNNEAIRCHMTAKLFPAMSYYKHCKEIARRNSKFIEICW